MSKKIYACKSSVFGFRVVIDGEEELVEFRSTNREKVGSTLQVTDPKMQAAIESSPFFGNVITLRREYKEVPADTPDLQKVGDTEPPTLVPEPQVVPVVETPMDTPVKKKVKADVPKGDAADSTLI